MAFSCTFVAPFHGLRLPLKASFSHRITKQCLPAREFPREFSSPPISSFKPNLIARVLSLISIGKSPKRAHGHGNGGGNNRTDSNGWSDGDGDDSEDDFNLALQASSILGTSLYLVSRRYQPRRSQWGPQRGTSPPTPESFWRELRISHVLLVVNLIVYAVQIMRGPGFLMAGAKVNSAIAAGELHRLLTPMFLHGSGSHIMINSFSLYSTGPSVESWFGKRRFLALYLLSGVAGNALSYLCTPAPAVGASGAIFGLVGATAIILTRHRKLLGPRARRSLQSLAYVVIMNFGFGLSPGSQVDNFGHLGGMLGGIAFAYLFGPRLVVRNASSGRAMVKDEPIYKLVVRDLQIRAQQIRRSVQSR